MQHKKILIACLSVLLVTLAVPTATVPRAHAFLSTAPSVTLSGLSVSGFTDPLTGTTVAGIASGAVLSVNVYVIASSIVYQRNVTIGFKGDWMNTYQNATTANPTQTLTMTAGQSNTITISVTMPTSGGIAAHSWNVVVMDGPAGSSNSPANNNAFCATPNFPEKSKACDLIPGQLDVRSGGAGYQALAIYTSDQLSAAQASVQGKATTMSLTVALGALSGGFCINSTCTSTRSGNTPGVSAATGNLAQAGVEQELGDQAWKNGDYSGAKTHYQNALNDANAGVAALAGQGGADNASLVNLLLGGTGIALIGIGALFAGLGAFFFLRKKPKA
jgi:hypothetical protein